MKEYEDEYISMEHILRAARTLDETTQQFVGNKEEVVKKLLLIREIMTSQKSRSKLKLLEKYGRDLVEEVLPRQNGHPVIGRDEETVILLNFAVITQY